MIHLKFNCDENYFQAVEMFLFQQEYSEKPEFDFITLNVNGKKYEYCVKKLENNLWYVLTN